MFDSAFSKLASQGWAVVDGACPEPLWRSVASWGAQKWEEQKFSPALVGRGVSQRPDPNVRADWIHWLEPTDLPKVSSFFENLRRALNRELFLSLKSFEFHIACYPPGAFYAPHIDQSPQNQPLSGQRVISAVLYLNSEWTEDQGGFLHLNNFAHKIFPVGGRLVLFRSDTILHEVVSSTRPRWSLTGWFRQSTL